MNLRITACLMLSPLVLSSGLASACTMLEPRPEEIARYVATNGVMIKGRVVQAYDKVKRRPEVIHAERVYVGDPGKRDFVIFAGFDERAVAGKTIVYNNVCGRDARHRVGEIIDRLVLMPVERPNSKVEWALNTFDYLVIRSPGLEALLTEAADKGRLVSRPESAR